MKSFTFFVAIICSIGSYAQTVDELWKKHAAEEYQYVIENSLKLEMKEPSNLDLKLLIGRTYTDSGQPAKALPYLLYVYKNDKKQAYQKAWAANYLGSSYYQLSDPNQSKRHLIDAISLNATENVTRDSKKKLALYGFSDAYTGFLSRESDHIIFHFNPAFTGNIDKFIQQAERSFENINSFFNSNLPKKIDFFVWNSKSDIKAATGSPGGFANPENSIIHANVDQTPGHELTHVISHYTADIGKKSILINEGTAVYFDQTKRDKMEQARAAVKTAGVTITIAEIWNSRSLDETVLYSVAGGFVELLLEKAGKAKFLAFFKNQTVDSARLIYGVEFDTLVKEFEDFVNLDKTPVQIKFHEGISLSELPKLDPEKIKEVLEQNPSDEYYKILILLNGQPVHRSRMNNINPTAIKNLHVVKSKADLEKYTDVELNGIIVITVDE